MHFAVDGDSEWTERVPVTPAAAERYESNPEQLDETVSAAWAWSHVTSADGETAVSDDGVPRSVSSTVEDDTVVVAYAILVSAALFSAVYGVWMRPGADVWIVLSAVLLVVVFFLSLVYLVATARGWDYPPGYGQYAFFLALWLAATVYVVNRRRYRAGDRGRPSTS